MTSLGKNLLFACLIGSLLAGCGSSEAPNEQNRFYLRGRKHVQANEPDKAVTAFRECLRRSPGSHKAHLELGMLSEDHLHDLNGAILHYRAFLKVSVDDQKNAAVRLWLNRVERDLLRELRLIYEGPELPRVARPASRPSTVPTAPRPPLECTTASSDRAASHRARHARQHTVPDDYARSPGHRATTQSARESLSLVHRKRRRFTGAHCQEGAGKREVLGRHLQHEP